MVATVGSIRVLFDVNYNRYEAGMKRAATVTEREGARMSRSVYDVDRATRQMNRTMSAIRSREFRVLSLAALRTKNSVERLRATLVATTALLGGFGTAFTVKGLMDYSDTYKEVGNRLRIVKNEAQSLAEIEMRIFEIAQRSRSTYESTGVLFARISSSARKLAISQKDVLRVTETIQKAFIVGGSTPIEATQSAIQLSQGIASNRLQGDELRSVLENPALGQLLADKISGGDLGRLRDMASKGELTARAIIQAFKGASEEIDKLFAGTQQTIGQAFVKVDNAILRYVGTSKGANDASRATVYLLNAIAENIDTVGDSLAILAGSVIALLGARGIGGLTSGLINSAKAARASRMENLRLAEALRDTARAEAWEAAMQSEQARVRIDRMRKERAARMKEAVTMMADSNVSKATKDATREAEKAANVLAAADKRRVSALEGVKAAQDRVAAAQKRIADLDAKAVADAQKRLFQRASSSVAALEREMAAADRQRASTLEQLTAAQQRSQQARARMVEVMRAESSRISDVARAELSSAETSFMAAERHRKASQSYYEMARANTVSANTRMKAGHQLQSALAAEAVAAKRLAAAQEKAALSMDASLATSREYLSAKSAVEKAQERESAGVDRYVEAERRRLAAVERGVALHKELGTATIAVGGPTKAQTKAVEQLARAQAALNDAQQAVVVAEGRHVAALKAAGDAQVRIAAASQNRVLSEEQKKRILEINERLQRRIQSAEDGLARAIGTATEATAAANVAQQGYQRALQQTSIRAMAAAGAMRVLGSALDFVGGPWGLALLAVTAAFSINAISAARAQERTDRYADAIKKAGDEAAGAAPKIREVAAAMAPKPDDDLVTLQRRFNQASADIDAFIGSLKSLGLAYSRTGLLDLAKAFEAGEASIEDVRAAVTKLVLKRPDLAKVAEEFLNTAKGAESARGTVDGLKAAIDKLKDKEVTISVRIAGGKRPFGQRDMRKDDLGLADRMAEDQNDSVVGQLKKQAEDLQKEIDAKKREIDAADRKDAAAGRRADADEKRRQREQAKAESDRQISSALNKYLDGLQELRNSGLEMTLDELDQKIIQQARSMEIAETQIRKYIDAVKTGGTEIPLQMQVISDEMRKIADTEKMVRFADSASNAFGDFLTNIVTGGQSAQEALRGLTNSLVNVAMQILVVEPLVRELRAAFMGMAGGGGFGIGQIAGAGGDPWAGMRVPTAHSGWAVGSGQAPGSKAVSAWSFAGAPRFHSGLASDEVAAILQKGETVLSRDQTAVAAQMLSNRSMGGGGGTEVNIYNNSGAEVQQQRRRSGGRDIVDIVVGAVNQGISTGKMDKSMSRFGAKPQAVRR